MYPTRLYTFIQKWICGWIALSLMRGIHLEMPVVDSFEIAFLFAALNTFLSDLSSSRQYSFLDALLSWIANLFLFFLVMRLMLGISIENPVWVILFILTFRAIDIAWSIFIRLYRSH